MRCTSPRTVGFESDGKTICWSPKKHSKEYATFQLPCGHCIECRLDYARQWAVRCVHEAQMHEENCFVTLTYSDENLKNPKLVYADFQLFMKRLRASRPNVMASDIITRREFVTNPIGMFVTGEYGEHTKRPHWHAIIFNWSPDDLKYFRTNDRGDKIYKSGTLEKLWGLGHCELGSVTFESAGYCARYAAKKLVHGKDGEHGYEPISKKSSKHAIGKKWLERFWPDVFASGAAGKIRLRDGSECGVPRYYEKWLKDNRPEAWERYVTDRKLAIISENQRRSEEEHKQWVEDLHRRLNLGRSRPLTKSEIREKIQKEKFKQLQNYLKL